MTSPAAPALEFAGVGKQFGGNWVLRHLDLAISTGSIVGLIGPSGCGKTTTIRIGTGVYRPDEGEAHMFGLVPHEMTAAQRAVIGYLPQEPVLFDELSVWQNLNFHASLNGVRFRRRQRLRALLDLVGLGGEERKLVRQASGGMKRRLALAGALVHEPPLLLLDEPTAGIDPVLRRRLWDHFRTLRDEGHTVVVATQYVGEAADCDQVVLLNRGRAAAVGSPDQLRRLALGGDVLTIETDGPVPPGVLHSLSRPEWAHRVVAVGPTDLRLTVEDGGEALPVVLDLLRAAGCNVRSSGEVAVDYDEVFITLVDQDRQGA